MLSSFKNWLQRVPITDPVDRRNAPTMQVLLLFIAITVPIAWIYFLSTAGLPPGGRVLLLIDALTATLAVVCVTMIRKGRFRLAITLFLGVLLVLGEIAYLQLGFLAQMRDQIAQMLLLVIGGLVLGRRGLWAVFAALMIIVASGIAVDAAALADKGEPIRVAFRHVPSVIFGYLVIALVLDRTVTALRESLDESNARGRELQREMIERERAQAQLIHAQKMEATGRLASGIAHDFNNILDVIMGFAAQRHDNGIGDSAQRARSLEDTLEGVEIAARRGSAISRKLLRFGRNDIAYAEVFDASDAIKELQPMLRQMFNAGVSLEASLADSPLPIRMDRSQFELMTLNIAANARDAMADDGGRFSIAAERMQDTRGDGVQLLFTDNGHGMDAEISDRIFEPFYSTKPADNGTGIGLAVVRDLVEQAGGRISVHTANGQGSTFCVWLPFAIR